jgi:hypothetical protein
MRAANRTRMSIVFAAGFAMMVPMMAAAKHVMPSPDVQGWNELDVSARINSLLDMTVSSQMRLSAQARNPATYSNGVDLNIRAADHLIVTSSYYLIASRTTAGTWAHSRVPILAATSWYTWGGWTFSSRSRFAQVKGDGSDFWLFQHRARLDYAIGGASLFVWDEISRYSLFHTWNRNRFAVGTRIAGSPRAAIDVYYIRQNDSRTRPRQIDGIGLTLELRFR